MRAKKSKKSETVPPVETPVAALIFQPPKWVSQEAIIATAPLLQTGQTYGAFFYALQEWAKPLLEECLAKRAGIVSLFPSSENKFPLDRNAPLWAIESFIASDEFQRAIEDYVSDWEPLSALSDKGGEKHFGDLNTGNDLAPMNARMIDSLIQSQNYGAYPPPPAYHWLMRGLREYRWKQGRKTLDECLGLVGRGSGKNNPMVAAATERRNHHFAFFMMVLTDNNLTPIDAATLVKAQDEFIRRREKFSDIGSRAEPLSITTICEYWTKVWKKQFTKKFKTSEYLTWRNEARKSLKKGLQSDCSVGVHVFGSFPPKALAEARKLGLKI